MNWLTSVGSSFSHAWRGLRLAFSTERSFRIQVAVALVVILLVSLMPFSPWERVILLVATSAVLVLELLNSTVERLVDLFKPRLHPYVRDVKDLMAGAVLVASIFALIVGLMVMWPYLGMVLGTL
ncbi:MAG: diacylglycerol kinase [Patescibacteria group bacterium]